jgi:hypothetical protein
MSAHRHHVSQHQQVKLAAHAHCMRVAPSEPERVLWARLRALESLSGPILAAFSPNYGAQIPVM